MIVALPGLFSYFFFYTICHGLFALPSNVVGRQYSVLVAIPGHVYSINFTSRSSLKKLWHMSCNMAYRPDSSILAGSSKDPPTDMELFGLPGEATLNSA